MMVALSGDPRKVALRVVGPGPVSALRRCGKLWKPARGRIRSHHRWAQLRHEVGGGITQAKWSTSAGPI